MTDPVIEAVPVDPPNGADQTVEMEAPWGLKDDGTPYKRDPDIYAKRDAGKSGTRKRRVRKSTAAKAPRPKAPSTPRAKAAANYREDVAGLFQLISLPLAFGAGKSQAMAADVVAIEHYSPPLIDAVADLAATNARVAAALDKLADVGPYGALIAAATPLVIQLMANHGVIPPGTLQTADPAVLAAQLDPSMFEPPAEPGGAYSTNDPTSVTYPEGYGPTQT